MCTPGVGWHRFGMGNFNVKNEVMEVLSFLFLCAVGALMYWFFFKCIDWFECI